MTTNDRQLVPAASRWAEPIGYSRAVRVGSQVFVSGTAPVAPDGSTASPGDPYLQAKRCLEIIVGALEQAGAKPEHVVRTRIYLTNAEHWQEVGKAHGEVFSGVMPATSLVVVARLIDDDMLVEIEADAVIPS
jgi:enamine deaminase RidA (YjgF/YER057c/UK114 family)